MPLLRKPPPPGTSPALSLSAGQPVAGVLPSVPPWGAAGPLPIHCWRAIPPNDVRTTGEAQLSGKPEVRFGPEGSGQHSQWPWVPSRHLKRVLSFLPPTRPHLRSYERRSEYPPSAAFPPLAEFTSAHPGEAPPPKLRPRRRGGLKFASGPSEPLDEGASITGCRKSAANGSRLTCGCSLCRVLVP